MNIQTVRYLAAFAALIVLCGLGHEFVHHATGALLCGAFGSKTFNSFELAAACANRPLAFVVSTWAGPVFTFALMWLGWHRLASGDAGQRRLGLVLIFANFPINRLLFALLGWNDEQYVTRTVIGDSTLAFWLTNLAVWVMALPPLVAAWRAMAGRRRLARYLALLLLPFVFVLVFGIVMEDWLLLRQRVLAQSVFGIPALLVVSELIALAAWYRWRPAAAAHGPAPLRAGGPRPPTGDAAVPAASTAHAAAGAAR